VVISVFMFVYAMFGPVRERVLGRTRTFAAPAE